MELQFVSLKIVLITTKEVDVQSVNVNGDIDVKGAPDYVTPTSISTTTVGNVTPTNISTTTAGRNKSKM